MNTVQHYSRHGQVIPQNKGKFTKSLQQFNQDGGAVKSFRTSITTALADRVVPGWRSHAYQKGEAELYHEC